MSKCFNCYFVTKIERIFFLVCVPNDFLYSLTYLSFGWHEFVKTVLILRLCLCSDLDSEKSVGQGCGVIPGAQNPHIHIWSQWFTYWYFGEYCFLSYALVARELKLYMYLVKTSLLHCRAHKGAVWLELSPAAATSGQEQGRCHLPGWVLGMGPKPLKVN